MAWYSTAYDNLSKLWGVKPPSASPKKSAQMTSAGAAGNTGKVTGKTIGDTFNNAQQNKLMEGRLASQGYTLNDAGRPTNSTIQKATANPFTTANMGDMFTRGFVQDDSTGEWKLASGDNVYLSDEDSIEQARKYLKGLSGENEQAAGDQAAGGNASGEAGAEAPGSIYSTDEYGNPLYTLSGEKVMNAADIAAAKALDKHQDWGYGDDYGRFTYEGTHDQWKDWLSDPELRPYYSDIFNNKEFWTDQNDPNSWDFEAYWNWAHDPERIRELAAYAAGDAGSDYLTWKIMNGTSEGAAHSGNLYRTSHPEIARFYINPDTNLDIWAMSLGYDPEDEASWNQFVNSNEYKTLMEHIGQDDYGSYFTMDDSDRAIKLFDDMWTATNMANEATSDIEGANYLRRLDGLESSRLGREADRPDLYYNEIQLPENFNYAGYNPINNLSAETLMGYVNGQDVDDITAQLAAARNKGLGYLTKQKIKS